MSRAQNNPKNAIDPRPRAVERFESKETVIDAPKTLESVADSVLKALNSTSSTMIGQFCHL